MPPDHKGHFRATFKDHIRPHYQDTESKQLYLIHRNKHRGGCQNEETRKHGPNERIDQNFRKRTKQKGDKQFIRCRVQNIGYKDAQVA